MYSIAVVCSQSCVNSTASALSLLPEKCRIYALSITILHVRSNVVFLRAIVPCYRATHAKCRLSSSSFECNCCLFPVVVRIIGRLAWTRLCYRNARGAIRDRRRCYAVVAVTLIVVIACSLDWLTWARTRKEYNIDCTRRCVRFRLLRYRYRHVNAQAFVTVGTTRYLRMNAGLIWQILRWI
jgi:hypothetical protein